MFSTIRKLLGVMVLLLMFLGAASLAFILLGQFVFGFEVRTVNGGSMAPVMPKGSLALVKPVAPEEISVGDIIAFRQPHNAEVIIVHRVVEVQQRLRSLGFLTKGDANESRDAGVVLSDKVLGKVTAHVHWVGSIVRFLYTPVGFLIFIVIPGLLLAWHEARNIMVLLRERKQDQVVLTSPEAPPSEGKGAG